MATKKSTKKKTATKKSTKKAPVVAPQRGSKKRQMAEQEARANSRVRGEIGILVTILIAILLFLGVINTLGDFGKAIADVMFGLFGILAYIFPFFFAAATIYLIRKLPVMGAKAVLKIFGFTIVFVSLCGIAALIDPAFSRGENSFAYFFEHGDNGFCGGFVGGSLGALLCSIIGKVGAYIVFVFAAIISFILTTGISLLRPVSEGGQIVKERTKENIDYIHETRLIRDEERRALRQERREERLESRRQRVAERAEQRAVGVAIEDTDLKAKASDDAETGEEKAKAAAQEFARERGLRIHRKDGTTELEKTPVSADEPTGVAKTVTDILNNSKTKQMTTDDIIANDVDGDIDFDDEDIPDIAINDYDVPESSEFASEIDEQIDEEPFDESALEQEPAQSKKPGPIKATRNYKTQEELHKLDGGLEGKEKVSSGAAVLSTMPAAPKPRKRSKKVYKLPPMSLLNKGEKGTAVSNSELKEIAHQLEQALSEFGVGATVTDISCGPTVTRYELRPNIGVRISQIENLKNDIALQLAAPGIRIEAPIPGKAAVGIEVPNSENDIVSLRDILETSAFKSTKSKLAFGLGRDIGGDPIVADLEKMPHLLVAGATGSGKSVCLNTIIMSILYRANPDEVKFIMIDPKQVELNLYQGIPHLLVPVVTDAKKAAGALNWCVAEMEQRYTKFKDAGAKGIFSYNRIVEDLQAEYDAASEHEPDEVRPEKLPELVVVVDEMADLMMVGAREVENAICRIAQLARAAGIHLVLATQRPSAKVVTGLIKANVPSKIAFSVSTSIDSRIILDMTGAEALIGKGDMLYAPMGQTKPTRVQGAFVSENEVASVVEFWKDQKDETSSAKEKAIAKEISSASAGGTSPAGGAGEDDNDELFEACGRFIIESQKASIGNLQRKFRIGFNRAARIMDQLEEAGVVGPEVGKKPREVIMEMEEFDALIESQY